jgi:hypothetical protein
VYSNFERVQTIAEKVSFPMVSDQPLVVWGLDEMDDWMHDTLEYFQKIRCMKVPSK